ncbi:NADAR domain-containing protein [Blautia sp.]|uniref:NADAR domain-containing protein n=1 Tax=Blautia sp. TaxID=1955243 RepID=UPI0035210E28
MEQFYDVIRRHVAFHDEKIANDILHTDNVAEIKKLGRKVHAYDENVWNGVRQLIVYEGL